MFLCLYLSEAYIVEFFYRSENLYMKRFGEGTRVEIFFFFFFYQNQVDISMR